METWLLEVDMSHGGTHSHLLNAHELICLDNLKKKKKKSLLSLCHLFHSNFAFVPLLLQALYMFSYMFSYAHHPNSTHTVGWGFAAPCQGWERESQREVYMTL